MDYTKDEDIPLVKGIDNVIRKLHCHFKLGIVTQNGLEVVSKKLREHHLEDYFSSIITIEKGFKIKPDPEGLLYCLNKLEVKPEEAVYIGDFPSDVKTAKAAGTHSISYLGGFGTKKKFKELPKEEYDYTVFIRKNKKILRLVSRLNQ